MSKIISAFAFATLLSLPAPAAVPSSAADQGSFAKWGVSERLPARVVEDASKVQEPRIRVATGGCAWCEGWDW
jgi:hypothetical protein